MRLLTHYKSYDHPRWHLKAKERKLLKDRLEDGYTVEELKMAIDGLHLTDWNMGKNPGGTEYLGIYYAFHEDKIDGRISTAEKHAKEIARERSAKDKLDQEHDERVRASEDRLKTPVNSTQLFRKALRKSSGTMN